MQKTTGNDIAIPDHETEAKSLQSLYIRLFHEMQFRATRNALMNFNEADDLKKKERFFKIFTNISTAAAASGLLAGIVKGGKVIASKAGLVGAIGLPICSVVKFFEQSSSELIPSYGQKAQKHISAAAGWASLAEIARAERMRIGIEPTRNVKEIATVYNNLVQKKATIASQVLIPQATHHYFSQHPEIVVEALKRRGDLYKQFVELKAANLPSGTEEDKSIDVIYF